MRGKHRVIVSTKRLKYDFELRRNLTIIRGDSATGKTILVDMIQGKRKIIQRIALPENSVHNNH